MDPSRNNCVSLHKTDSTSATAVAPRSSLFQIAATAVQTRTLHQLTNAYGSGSTTDLTSAVSPDRITLTTFWRARDLLIAPYLSRKIVFRVTNLRGCFSDVSICRIERPILVESFGIVITIMPGLCAGAHFEPVPSASRHMFHLSGELAKRPLEFPN